MTHGCECGELVYFLDDECPYCGRKMEFGVSGDDRDPSSEKQRELFNVED